MRILMLVTKYSLKEDSPYMTDELASELTRQGHEVRVLWVNWEGCSLVECSAVVPNMPIVTVVPAVLVNYGSLKFRRAIRWILTPFRVAWTARSLQKNYQPDMVVAYSPLTALWLPVWLLTSRLTSRKYLVQWDFFPDAQYQDGALKSKFAARFLKNFETWLINRFDIVGCMSPRNIEYLRGNFPIKNSVKIEHLPLWTSRPSYTFDPRSNVRERYGLPVNKVIFIFGGQFVVGRGLDEVIAAAEICGRMGNEFCMVFAGQGPLQSVIDAAALRDLIDVRVINKLPRTEYLKLLSACDVGIVCTLRVAVPTFPSKSLDYLQVGLPILASVDQRTDFGDFIESNEIGLQAPAGDVGLLAEKMAIMIRLVTPNLHVGTLFKEKADFLLRKHFAVDGVARILLQK
jgi:glycosyltransferase involved in cell wall biosynthesis